ncbi:hypothetical protein ACFOW1_09620 [Parasediminibacterium paludis]|uniref:Uncharacterized protein n=1 Tax=Parasediminibacterium paludis TaxID=908966 RepID=A0ABV8PVJ3_9BACT
MLNPQEVLAIAELSEPTKAILTAALTSFNKDIVTIANYCNAIDQDSSMKAFHDNVLAHSSKVLEIVELMTFSSQPLIQHFAPKH